MKNKPKVDPVVERVRELQIRNRMIYEAIIKKVVQEIWDRPSVPPVTSYRSDQELHPQ